MLCLNCGKLLEQGCNFCSVCGRKFSGVATQSLTDSIATQSNDKTGLVIFEVDTQPFLLPLEKIELYINDRLHERTYKFGSKGNFSIKTGVNSIYAVLKIPLIKRTSNTLEVSINAKFTSKLFLSYTGWSGSINLSQ